GGEAAAGDLGPLHRLGRQRQRRDQGQEECTEGLHGRLLVSLPGTAREGWGLGHVRAERLARSGPASLPPPRGGRGRKPGWLSALRLPAAWCWRGCRRPRPW